MHVRICSCGTWYTENISMVRLYSTPTMNTWPVEMTNVLYQSQSLCIILQLQTSPAGIRETAEQTTNPATTNEKSLCESKAFSPCNLFFHHLIVKTERRIKERSIRFTALDLEILQKYMGWLARLAISWDPPWYCGLQWGSYKSNSDGHFCSKSKALLGSSNYHGPSIEGPNLINSIDHQTMGSSSTELRLQFTTFFSG